MADTARTQMTPHTSIDDPAGDISSYKEPLLEIILTKNRQFPSYFIIPQNETIDELSRAITRKFGEEYNPEHFNRLKTLYNIFCSHVKNMGFYFPIVYNVPNREVTEDEVREIQRKRELEAVGRTFYGPWTLWWREEGGRQKEPQNYNNDHNNV